MTGSDNIMNEDPMTGTKRLLHDGDRTNYRRGQMTNMTGSDNITYERGSNDRDRRLLHDGDRRYDRRGQMKKITGSDNITYEHPMTGASPFRAREMTGTDDMTDKKMKKITVSDNITYKHSITGASPFGHET